MKHALTFLLALCSAPLTAKELCARDLPEGAADESLPAAPLPGSPKHLALQQCQACWLAPGYLARVTTAGAAAALLGAPASAFATVEHTWGVYEGAEAMEHWGQ